MITILGAGGAIGSELVKELTARNECIRLVSRNPKLVPDAAETVAADLSNLDHTVKAVTGSRIAFLPSPSVGMSVRKLPILPADHRAFVVVHELVSRNHLHYSLGVLGAKMYVMPQLGVRISWRERCKPGLRHQSCFSWLSPLALFAPRNLSLFVGSIRLRPILLEVGLLFQG
jgi:hypothetical protein